MFNKFERSNKYNHIKRYYISYIELNASDKQKTLGVDSKGF